MDSRCRVRVQDHLRVATSVRSDIEHRIESVTAEHGQSPVFPVAFSMEVSIPERVEVASARECPKPQDPVRLDVRRSHDTQTDSGDFEGSELPLPHSYCAPKRMSVPERRTTRVSTTDSMGELGH